MAAGCDRRLGRIVMASYSVYGMAAAVSNRGLNSSCGRKSHKNTEPQLMVHGGKPKVREGL